MKPAPKYCPSPYHDAVVNEASTEIAKAVETALQTVADKRGCTANDIRGWLAWAAAAEKRA